MHKLTIRPIGPDESLAPFFDLDDLGFHATTSPGRRAQLSELIDRRESLCAYDDGRLVGSSLIWPQSLSVPGGYLPCGAVSWVCVAPTHRRQGLLRTMMDGQLTRLAQSGTPLAALWASEATIYGRFGFGPASWSHSYDVQVRDRGSGTVRPGGPLAVAMVDPGCARPALQAIYDRAGVQRAGVLSRDERWWTHAVLAQPTDDLDDGALRIVTAGDPAEGYAIYRATPDDTAPPGGPRMLEVKELVSTTLGATQALWSYLLSIDLIARVSARRRPVDEPLGLMLKDLRTAKRTEGDALWLRLLDLPRALTSRRWEAPFELVLEIDDALIAANAGRWQLSSADGQGRCVRTDRPADLVLTIAQLGASYLGGGSLVRALDAGLVDERTPGAAARLDRAARTARAPWTVAVF